MIKSNHSAMRNRLYCFFLVALVLIIYGQTISFEFISDDLFYLNENHLIRHPLNVWKLINVPVDGVMGEMSAGLLKSRNLRDVSYAFDYWIWGESAFGFHVTNIILHLLSGLLLYHFSRLYLTRDAAFICTAIFLLHPINSEVVAYISGRKESLMSIAILTSILTLEKSRTPGNAWLFPFSLAAYVAAFFVKEAAIIAAGLIIFKDLLLRNSLTGHNTVSFRSKRRVTEWLFVCLTGLAIFLVRYDMSFFSNRSVETIMSIINNSSVETISAGPLYLSPLFLIPFYTFHFLFPFDLQFEYRGGFPDYWSWLINSAVFQWSFLLLLVALMIYLMRRKRIVAYGAIWFYLALAPVLHFIPFHTPAAEHYLYLPSMGACLIAGHLISKVTRPRIKQSGIILLLIVMTIFSFLRVQDYKNDFTLFKSDYATSRKSAYAYYGMVLGGIRSGDIGIEKGTRIFENFRQRGPKVGTYYFILGHLYEKSGETEKARENYKKAINYGKRPWEVYVALARLELENDNTIQAEDILLTLNDNYPYHPKSYILLGTLKMMADDPTAALEYYQKAGDLDIHSKEAGIGNDFALWRLGRMPSPQFILLHPEVFKDVESEEETLAESIILYLSKAPKNPGALEVMLK